MDRSSTSTSTFGRGTVNQWLLSALSILLTIGLCTLWIMNRPGPPKYSELRISTPRISAKSGNQPKLTLEVGEQVVKMPFPEVSFSLEPGQSLSDEIPSGPFKATINIPFVLQDILQGTVVVDFADCRVGMEHAGRVLASGDGSDGPARIESGLFLPAGTSDLQFVIEASGPAPRFEPRWRPEGSDELEPLPITNGT